MLSSVMSFPEQEPALKVEKVSKAFHIYDSPRQRLAQWVIGRRKKLYREFWALSEISLELGKGETLGVVGRNGSGKSTLLQIICGTLQPTHGKIWRHGRIGALLELGSGFNPEFDGIENIKLNAMLMGLSAKEVDQRLDDIIRFSEIKQEFLKQPIKHYSSGMVVRLAFAVQANIQPEILIVDEALAVGDEQFQRKCYRRLEELREAGSSTLLVTHNCQVINQYCDRAVLLHQGKLKIMGKTQKITALYQQLANASEEEWERTLNAESTPQSTLTESTADSEPRTDAVIYPARGARIESVEVRDDQGHASNRIEFTQGFQLVVKYRAEEDFSKLGFGCHLADPSGRRFTGQVYPADGTETGPFKAGSVWTVKFSFKRGLLPGLYYIGAGLWSEDSPHSFIHRVVDISALRIIATDQIPRIGTCDLQAREPELQQTELQGRVGPEIRDPDLTH